MMRSFPARFPAVAAAFCLAVILCGSRLVHGDAMETSEDATIVSNQLPSLGGDAAAGMTEISWSSDAVSFSSARKPSRRLGYRQGVSPPSPIRNLNRPQITAPPPLIMI